MELQPAETVEILTMSKGGRASPASSTSGGKRAVPMHIDYDSLQLSDKDDSNKLRRPVRPVDRQRMRPWLMELLDVGNVYGLNWTNRHQGVFQISWRHASRLGWNLETDGDVFERWARHTGIYKEGDPPEPKRWKANFRCALHSLHDVVELTTALERRGRNACRTYRFLHSTDERSVSRKRAKARKAKEYHKYERPREEVEIHEVMEPQQAPVYEFVTTKIVSNEDLEPATESDSEEETKQDRVIVQKLELKSDVAEEEFGLHHDHDYSVLPDKSQKTIVLRQGIGSIVLHKEVLGAPDRELVVGERQKSASSNLEQLASAAVSTAGWNTVLAPGLGTSQGEQARTYKQRIKTSLMAKDLAAAKLIHSEDERAAYSLKYLLTGNKEDAEEASNISVRPSKKRRVEALPDHHHASISVGAEETVSTEATAEDETGEMFPFVPQKVAKAPRRTASPRILSGAKARRQRSKSERTDSESTEPLMSSCLLLLEAATRLDNAEKDKTTDGVRTRIRGRGSARTSVTSSTSKGVKLLNERAHDSDGDSESSAHNQGEETMIITADQDLHRVLRKTLESLKNRTAKASKQEEESTITLDIAEEGWVEGAESAEAVVVVSDTQDMKGLFSGSSIPAGGSTQYSHNVKSESGEVEASSCVDEGDVSGSEELAAVAAGAAIVEDAIIESAQGAEYVEMVIPEEEGVAYIQADSMPGEIIIESVGGEEADDSKDESASISSSAVIEHIPPGSILLQTGDGTPIGMLGADGKLMAFQSAEARSVISLLASKIAESPPAGEAESFSSVQTIVTSSEVITDGNHTVMTPEVPHNTTASTSQAVHESQSPEVIPVASEIVKQEPDVEDEENISLPDASVKIEIVEPSATDTLNTADDSANTYATEAVSLNPKPNDAATSPCLAHALLQGLATPFTFEGMLSNFEKSLQMHGPKLCSCVSNVNQKTAMCPSSKVLRLEDLCKQHFVKLCFTSLNSKSVKSITANKIAAKLHPGKKISILPQLGPGTQLLQVVKGNSAAKFDSKSVMDPTTPFSLGEIPLFDSAKGDSDSMSPPSE